MISKERLALAKERLKRGDWRLKDRYYIQFEHCSNCQSRLLTLANEVCPKYLPIEVSGSHLCKSKQYYD
jgi:hypothetical protein